MVPKKETDIAISLLQNNFNHMEETISELKDTMVKHYSKQEEQMAQLIESMDRKYSAKWVEKAAIFMASSIWTVIITALMYLILKK